MYSRQKVVDLIESWVGRNEADGSHKMIIDIYNTQKTLQEIRYVPVFKQLNFSSYLPASYTETLCSTSYGYCSLPHTWKSG